MGTIGGSISEDDDEDFVEWRREFEANRQRVLKAPGVAEWLSELAGRGAETEKLLMLLVISCPTQGDDPMRQELRKRIKNLREQAIRLEIAADELEATFSTDLGFAETWKRLLFPVAFKGIPDFTNTRTALKLRCEGIRRLARGLKGEAAAFARQARHYPRLNERFYLGRLITYVSESTGQYHDRILAPLLTAAHNELGVEVDYSELKLQKFRQRNLPNLIRTRQSQFFTADVMKGVYSGLPDDRDASDK